MLPGFRAYQLEVESREGRYPTLLAFLGLLSTLLGAGHLDAPLPAYVMHVLHELLPSLHQLPFSSSEARWAVTAAALKVCPTSSLSLTPPSRPNIAKINPGPRLSAPQLDHPHGLCCVRPHAAPHDLSYVPPHAGPPAGH